MIQDHKLRKFSYEKNGVTLKFEFLVDDNYWSNIETFMELMSEAAVELKSEFPPQE